MGARYPFLPVGRLAGRTGKGGRNQRAAPSTQPPAADISHGLVYQRVPHITLKSIANNTEIDVIWERFEEDLEPLRQELTNAIPDDWLDSYRNMQKYTGEVPPEILEWEIPREFPEDWPEAARNCMNNSGSCASSARRR